MYSKERVYTIVYRGDLWQRRLVKFVVLSQVFASYIRTYTEIKERERIYKRGQRVGKGGARRLRASEEMSLLKRQKRASSTHQGHQRDKAK